LLLGEKTSVLFCGFKKKKRATKGGTSSSERTAPWIGNNLRKKVCLRNPGRKGALFERGKKKGELAPYAIRKAGGEGLTTKGGGVSSFLRGEKKKKKRKSKEIKTL